MIAYVNQAEEASRGKQLEILSTYYLENGGWQGFERRPRSYAQLILGEEFVDRPRQDNHRAPAPRMGPGGPGLRRPVGAPPSLPTLLGKEKQHIIGPPFTNQMLFAVRSEGVIVGWLGVKPPKYPTNGFNLSIKNNIFPLVGFVLLGTLVFVMGIGLPLSRHFVLPIKSLASSAGDLAEGKYKEKIQLARSDELGELAGDIESLRLTLSANQTLRSRWVADTSHELRTPLTIALGEIDAMLADVRPMNKNNLSSVRHEIEHLTRLVGDLSELANAEIGALSYHKYKVDLSELIQDATQRFEGLFTRRLIELSVLAPESPVFIWADEQRIDQVLTILLSNEVKYALTEGQVKVSVELQKNSVVLRVEDSGPGVASEHLPHLFDHMYRVSSSRNRKTGGAGLGLAICKNIIEAHDGKIHAKVSHLGGLCVEMQLPLVSKPASNNDKELSLS